MSLVTLFKTASRRSVQAIPRIAPFRRPVPARFQYQRTYTTQKPSTPQSAKISSLPSSQQVIQQAKDKAAPKVGKLKELAQKYGAVGVLVYLGVGCVDLGLTFATIEMVGQQKVKQVEKSVLDIFKNAKAKMGLGEAVPTSTEESAPAADDDDEKASFASMFLLAYGIHKTVFLPVRLGITAAITPAVVRKLHALGWARYAPKLLGGAKKA